jgi:hypothetical protein
MHEIAFSSNPFRTMRFYDTEEKRVPEKVDR